ncbi:MAG: hypothetical protein GTO55_07895 [Armatimonadetes bacterium]|nr:hypothetical protein [Armatimonadota bacterium]NIM24180.1 hypothetical protein [Armatimonadota bacterium]NIM68045.1 hypothetical protein [Armatimonadota bacterium]NIM76079.1 hypothetical protein [Armatimonadota bacterium]NIN05750.1 hypothetical protein [Armatimonadota bacterium]
MTSFPKRTKRYEPIVKLTAVIAFAALLQVVVLWRQSSILRQQATILEKTIEMSINDQRAWVKPVITNVPVIEQGVVPRVDGKVTNHGKTPATNLQKKSTYAVFAEGQHPEPQYKITDPIEPSSSTLFPGEELEFCAEYDRPLTPEEVRVIKNDTRPLHLFVEITYKDSFGRPRRTTLGQRLVRSHSDPSKWEWRMLGYYNKVE